MTLMSVCGCVLTAATAAATALQSVVRGLLPVGSLRQSFFLVGASLSNAGWYSYRLVAGDPDFVTSTGTESNNEV